MTALEYRPTRAGGVQINTSMTVHEAERLRELATGKRVLEVGSAFGFSTITMGQHAASLVAVDPHDGRARNGNAYEYEMLAGSLEVLRSNLRDAGLTNKVEIRVGRSQDLLPELLYADYEFDLVFIDGDHSYAATLRDLRDALRLLSPDGVLAVHDYGEDTCPGVQRAVDKMFPDGPRRLTDTLWEAVKPC